MPVNEGADFIAIDEIQLATDPDRGHVFTDRILRARGRHETMLLGADTMRPALQALDLDIDGERRERFSQLCYAGPIKITKLPKRSAVVAFSAEEVYAIAELLKRQRGGCAVIMGALSPRTRNAQVDLYQSGEVDYIVATDAIGMGLNLDVGHIAFASRRKFDGRQRRFLRPDELAQIAGRAGPLPRRRHVRRDRRVRAVRGRNRRAHRQPPFRTGRLSQLAQLRSRLEQRRQASLPRCADPRPDVILRRAPEALDEITLALAGRDRGCEEGRAHRRPMSAGCGTSAPCPTSASPGPEAHLKLVRAFVEKLIEPSARIKDEWMFEHVERLDRTEGDIEMLQQRLADIRTWTYAANRGDWLENAETWRGRTREIEDRLSDALHQALMQRFVDRRTSALLKTLNSEEDAPAEIGPAGEVVIGGHKVGQLEGLVFSPDATGETLAGRALRDAALKSLKPVIERRLAAIASAPDTDFSFDTPNCPDHPRMRACGEARSPGPDWHSPSDRTDRRARRIIRRREAAQARLGTGSPIIRKPCSPRSMSWPRCSRAIR